MGVTEENNKMGKIKAVTVGEVLRMSYQERLANYEREKMLLPRHIKDHQTYENALRLLAKKWRV